jgi:hypothetical protein
MTITQRLVLLFWGLALLGVTLELIRKRRLREEYAVLWICTGLMIVVFVIMPSALFTVSSWLSLDHAVLMTFLCFCFLAAIVMHYSVVISKHSEREKILAQELAMLRDELNKLKEQAREPPPTPVQPRPKPPSLRT